MSINGTPGKRSLRGMRGRGTSSLKIRFFGTFTGTGEFSEIRGGGLFWLLDKEYLKKKGLVILARRGL